MNDDNKPLRQEDCRAPAALPIDLHISHIDHMIDLDIKQQGPHRSPCNTRTRAFSKPKTNLASTGSFPLPPLLLTRSHRIPYLGQISISLMLDCLLRTGKRTSWGRDRRGEDGGR